jgi:hypothetical protein
MLEDLTEEILESSDNLFLSIKLEPLNWVLFTIRTLKN